MKLVIFVKMNILQNTCSLNCKAQLLKNLVTERVKAGRARLKMNSPEPPKCARQMRQIQLFATLKKNFADSQ